MIAADLSDDFDEYLRERPGFMHRLIASRNGRVGVALLAAIVALCIAGPVLLGRDPNAIDMNAFGSPPSWQHLMGTDDLGRDELTRIMYGGRLSLFVGLVAMAIGVGIGGTLGAISGFLGGRVDFALMRVVDVVLSIPSLFLLLFLAVVLPHGLLWTAFTVGAVTWMRPARLMRAQVLEVKGREFVEASYAIGNPPWRTLLFTIVPNALSALIVESTLMVGHAIVTESIMSFLGFGIQPPDASWGNMLTNAQTFVIGAPWLALFPGLMIFLTVLGFNLLGDGVRDSLA